ncbi:sensor histidine kinase [Clostridium sp. B9]|uniref:sensor histidine kinase n=1 Tax=Clostridium sp. B9 TaxID=3423224 RepID=UPI003D2EF50A
MKRRDIFYKTKRSVALISVSIVFFCLLIFSIITVTLYSSRVFNEVDKGLIKEKEKFEIIFNPLVNKSNFNAHIQNIPPTPPNIIAIEYINGNLYGMNRNPYFDETQLPKLTEKSTEEIQKITYNGYNFRGVSIKNGNIKVELLINVDSEIQSISQLIKTILIALIILIGIALILSYVLASKVIKPIKEAYDKQVFFVQDASHEMKTPLAVIKGKLELLANSWNDTIEDKFEHISKMMSEVRSLEKLNSDLLLLSKEDIDSSSNISEFELETLVEDLSGFYLDLAEVQNKKFHIESPTHAVMVKWDYSKIKRVIIILLENAFKYTEESDDISLSFHEVNRTIKITVSDTGIGIKEEDKNRVFDRFFRSADVRGKNINGSGIGLSLLKSISNTFGIKVNLYSEYGVGTKFELIVPKSMS